MEIEAMTKWIIRWDAGYGEAYEVVEADSKEEAQKAAYEEAKEEFERNVDYDAEAYDEDKAEFYGIA